MRKLSSFILAFALLFSIASNGVVLAVGESVVNVSSCEGVRGDTVEFSVSLNYGNNMQACNFELYYDPTVVEVVSATKGANLPSSPIINPNTLGKIVFSYASTTSTTNSVVLMNVTLKIKSNAPYGESSLRVVMKDLADGHFAAIEHTVKDGKITVVAPRLDPPFDLEFVSVSDTSVRILWSPVPDATGYNIYLNGQKYNEKPITENIYELTELIQNSSNYLELTTVNYTVESEKSTRFEFKTDKTVFNVVFAFPVFDDDGSIQDYTYSYCLVKYGDKVEMPIPPEIEGYTFVKWDRPVDVITEAISVTAEYEINKYTVTFKDKDGNVISTLENIEHGSAVEPPEPPAIDGFVFMGWDKSTSNITQDTVVTAMYSQNACDHIHTKIIDAVQSTCTAPGYSGDIVCVDCGKTISIGSETSLAPHKYVNTIVPATPSEQGYTLHKCSVCGNEYRDSYTDYVDENAPQIVVGNVRGIHGSKISVPISLKNNPGIASMSLKVHFDSTVMKLVEVKDAGVLGSQVHSPGYTEPYSLTWANDTATTDFTTNGTIVTLTFEIFEDATVGQYPISISYDYDGYDIYNVNVERVKFETTVGYVDVSDVLIGDVNGDGLVNNLDRLTLTRCLANWPDYPRDSIIEAAADVNCDGLVNNLDRLILTRYLADWPEYSTLPYVGGAGGIS